MYESYFLFFSDGRTTEKSWGEVLDASDNGQALNGIVDTPFSTRDRNLSKRVPPSTWRRHVDDLISNLGALPASGYRSVYAGMAKDSADANRRVIAALYLSDCGCPAHTVEAKIDAMGAGLLHDCAAAAVHRYLDQLEKVWAARGSLRPSSYKKEVAACDELIALTKDFHDTSYTMDASGLLGMLDMVRVRLIEGLVEAGGRVQQTARRHGLRIPQVVDPECLIKSEDQPALGFTGQTYIWDGSFFKAVPGGNGTEIIKGLRGSGMADRYLKLGPCRVLLAVDSNGTGYIDVASASGEKLIPPFSPETTEGLRTFGITTFNMEKK